MKVLSVLVAFLAFVLTSAQFGGMGMDMMFGPVATLMRPEIRKELKLSKDQGKQIDGIVNNTQKTEINLGSLGKVDAAVMDVLDERQKQRYFELSIQIRGGVALTDPIVATKLELTDEQVASAKRIRKAGQDKMLSEARKGSRDSHLMENISKAEEKDLLALLTPEQKIALTKLGGEVFKGARMKGMWPV